MRTTSNAPPPALPPSCATWAAIRMSDRAGTYAPSETVERANATRAPLETEASVPIASTSARRIGTGIAGQAIVAASSAETRSQLATSRRGRTRSMTPDRSPPPRR